MSASSTEFRCPSPWLVRSLDIAVVGAGGTGGEVLDGLVRLHHALVALGHPGGLQVTVIDPDTVSQSNVLRQRFWPSDIGLPKASTLVQRLNAYHGLDWSAQDRELTIEDVAEAGLLVTCVDKAAVRLAVAEAARDSRSPNLWLDTGNEADHGQVVLGHWGGRKRGRLPHVVDLFPMTKAMDADDRPSCSAQEALRAQSLPINSQVALVAINLLWRLMRHGVIRHHGALVNTAAGSVRPIAIDAKVWAAMGYISTETQREVAG